MSMRPGHIVTVLVLLLLVLTAGQSFGFPGFARKYSPTTSVFTFMPCASCHDPFPQLTPFGRRFKQNGFRVEGETISASEVIKSFPVAVRTSVSRSGIGDGDGTTRSGVKVISAASLGSVVSYWVDLPFGVNSDGFDRGNVNHAWVGGFDLTRAWKRELLNVRAGRFELDLPFSQAKKHNRFPYDPYFLRGDDRSWRLSSSNQGLEISGRPVDWAHYSIAFTETVRRSQEATFDPDLYARFEADFGRANRVGLFFYDGRDEVVSDAGTTNFEHEKLGADIDLRFARSGITVYGLYLWGRDRGVEDTRSNGGWVQFEKQTTSWLMFTTRYTHLGVDGARSDSLALGAHAWFRERLRIGFEYRLQRGPAPNNGSLIIDFVI